MSDAKCNDHFCNLTGTQQLFIYGKNVDIQLLPDGNELSFNNMCRLSHRRYNRKLSINVLSASVRKDSKYLCNVVPNNLEESSFQFKRHSKIT